MTLVNHFIIYSSLKIYVICERSVILHHHFDRSELYMKNSSMRLVVLNTIYNL